MCRILWWAETLLTWSEIPGKEMDHVLSIQKHPQYSNSVVIILNICFSYSGRYFCYSLRYAARFWSRAQEFIKRGTNSVCSANSITREVSTHYLLNNFLWNMMCICCCCYYYHYYYYFHNFSTMRWRSYPNCFMAIFTETKHVFRQTSIGRHLITFI